MIGFLSEQSIEVFTSIIDHNTDGIFVLSTEGRIIEANQGLTESLGYAKEELLGVHYKELTVPEHLDMVNEKFAVVVQGIPCEYKMDAIHKSGEIIHLHVKNIPLIVNGEVIGVFGIAMDITEQHRLVQALKESEERYRLLAENSLDLIQQVDLDGIVTYASPSHQMVLGYDPQEYVGKWVFHRPDEGVDTDFQAVFLNMVVSQEPFTYEIVRRHKDGHQVWLELKGTPMFDEEGNFKNMMFVGREITERKKYQDQLEYYSFHDSLTGVPNRRLFYMKLKESIEEAQHEHHGFAVLYLDLDKFKDINDTFGHDVGDELLKQFVARVKTCIPESAILARMGGDEFVICLSDAHSLEQAVVIADQILEGLQHPWNINDVSFITTSSIGIALYEPGDTHKTLLKKADSALYQAKEEGKNKYSIYKAK